MADPSRFRTHKNGPLASAMYNQKHTHGCYGCEHNKRTKTENQLRYCLYGVLGYPHNDKYNCDKWKKRMA